MIRMGKYSSSIVLVFLVGLCQFIQGESNPEVDSASLPAEHRSASVPVPQGYGPPSQYLDAGLPHGPADFGLPQPQPSYGSPLPVGPDDPWPLAAPDMPQIKAINVQCEKSHMRVNIQFDRPFYGMIFSKGHYSDANCVHLQPGSGRLDANFDIFINSCGMSSSGNNDGYGNQPTASGSYVENTVIIQYDPLVQEVWDQARKLRCTWYDFYEKSVTFRPFQVDMLSAVTANFLGDNLQCWMQIQVGKGPWASEVSGIVKIGQTMTMVLAIKDDENKFDMLVRNCVAHDGKRAPIQLVDQQGCVTRPKIMSRFQKIKNFGASATVVSYAYFQAFKFPDSMNVHFQCVIQVCRYNCPEPRCAGEQGGHYEVGPGPQIGGGYGPPGPAALQQGALGPAGLGIPDPRVPSQHLDAQAYAKREGLPDAEDTFSVQRVGQPRSADNIPANELQRKRRSVHVYRRDATEMADIETSRTIRVVAPGDVAFSLNSDKETVVISQPSSEIDNSICLSLPGFIAGLVMLLLVLVVAALIAFFMFMRIRSSDGKKGSSTTFLHTGYDNTEFVKVAH